jgi:hypothetical protein
MTTSMASLEPALSHLDPGVRSLLSALGATEYRYRLNPMCVTNLKYRNGRLVVGSKGTSPFFSMPSLH